MNELVFQKNGQALTTSNAIADAFGKAHKHVLDAIRSLEIPESFGKPNFRPSEKSYINNLGYTVKQPCYEITRDGFTLLAMGFTGKKAMAFKIKYIEAFNEMERALSNPAPKKKDGRGAPLGNQNARKKPLALPAPESPIKIATAYEQPAFEEILRRIVREELAELFAPAVKETSEQAKAHPSGMPFGNWAASIVHAVGGMRSEYEALQKAKSTGADDRIKAIRQIVGA